MAGDRIRHAGSDPDPRARRGGEPELEPDVSVQVLAVGDEQAVIVPLLGSPGELGGPVREGEGMEPDFDRASLTAAAA